MQFDFFKKMQNGLHVFWLTSLGFLFAFNSKVSISNLPFLFLTFSVLNF